MIQNNKMALKTDKTLALGGLTYQVEVVNSYEGFNILSYNPTNSLQ